MEADAEVIIGAITDTSLEGKIRVSIVATSLDNQHPESKSVVNMVHRIQNRNPGYSDFGSNGATASFSFSNNFSNAVTHGANALKLEDEVVSENIWETIEVESTNQDLLPFLLTIPLQKLAYYSALKKGFDIDKPRNLAKSVTVE